MLDHVGMPVSDYAASKAFYLKVLSALGYGLVMEVSSEETGGQNHAGFGAGGRPQFWIGTGKPIKGRVHFAFMAKDRPPCGRFTRPRCRPAARTMAPPVCARITTTITTGPSFSIPTATISRRFAT